MGDVVRISDYERKPPKQAPKPAEQTDEIYLLPSLLGLQNAPSSPCDTEPKD